MRRILSPMVTAAVLATMLGCSGHDTPPSTARATQPVRTAALSSPHIARQYRFATKPIVYYSHAAPGKTQVVYAMFARLNRRRPPRSNLYFDRSSGPSQPSIVSRNYCYVQHIYDVPPRLKPPHIHDGSIGTVALATQRGRILVDSKVVIHRMTKAAALDETSALAGMGCKGLLAAPR
jgi:hypothetical protein